MTVHLKLTNKNDFIIVDRYDGVPFTFEPKKPIIIPADAAAHIFGWSPEASMEDVERHTCRRLGWNTPDHMKNSTGRRFFKNLQFDKVAYRMVEVTDDENITTEIPLKGGSGQKMTAAPN